MSHERDITRDDQTNCTRPRRRAAVLLRTAAVLAAMLFGWFFPAEQAAADCGHYVVILNPSATAKANQRAMALSHSRDPATPKPCDGPQCRSRMPGSLPVAPPVTQTVTVDHHAILTAAADLIAPTAVFTSFESPFHLPPAHLPTAEPPPRV